MSEMTIATEVTIQKARWAPGPWQTEPDRVEFEHAGLPCLLVRSSMGMWCGYAAVAPGHPLHKVDYNEVDVEVHGGLTYSDACQGVICHIPKPGELDDVWWFGFDCAHSGDLVPSYSERVALFRGEYRTVDYARSETERLAEQLAAYAVAA